MKIPKVLILEDDENIRNRLRTMLEKIGINVVTAGDGEKGLSMASNADLVLLNLGLPKKTGLEVLRELREGGNYVPVIVVTGDTDHRKEAEQYKIVDFVEKPYHPRELLDKILRALRINRNIEEISEATQRIKSFVEKHS